MKGKLQLLLFLLALLLHLQSVIAANYYFSSSLGNDSLSPLQAQNSYTPWASLQKLNAYFHQLHPGDSILFKRGDVFYGEISCNASGLPGSPLVLSAYGTGKEPVITGLTALANWKRVAPHIWVAPVLDTTHAINMVVVDGKPYAMGRFPNAGAPNAGYLNIEAPNDSTLRIPYANSKMPLFESGEIVIRVNRWTICRQRIKRTFSNGYVFDACKNYPIVQGSGYFVQNNLHTLDQYGEWYNDSAAHLFYIYLDDDYPKENIFVSSKETLVDMQFQHDIVITGITFTGANETALLVSKTCNIAINNCSLLNTGRDAIRGYNINHLHLTNNYFARSNNSFFYSDSCAYVKIENNKLANCGLFAGACSPEGNSCEALVVHGNCNAVTCNQIDSIGYIAIDFRGDSAMISDNVIDYFCVVKDDGAAIYSWVGANAQAGKGSCIKHNSIAHGIGSPQGTLSPNEALAVGIYLDDNCANVDILQNTISYCPQAAIYLHNTQHVRCTENLFYHCPAGVSKSHNTSTCQGCLMFDNKVFGNFLH